MEVKKFLNKIIGRKPCYNCGKHTKNHSFVGWYCNKHAQEAMNYMIRSSWKKDKY